MGKSSQGSRVKPLAHTRLSHRRISFIPRDYIYKPLGIALGTSPGLALFPRQITPLKIVSQLHYPYGSQHFYRRA